MKPSSLRAESDWLARRDRGRVAPGYGVAVRAVKGHEFGLNLSAADCKALSRLFRDAVMSVGSLSEPAEST